MGRRGVGEFTAILPEEWEHPRCLVIRNLTFKFCCHVINYAVFTVQEVLVDSVLRMVQLNREHKPTVCNGPDNLSNGCSFRSMRKYICSGVFF